MLGPLVDGLGLLKGGLVPGWFTSDVSLVILGVLAALEIAAQQEAPTPGPCSITSTSI